MRADLAHDQRLDDPLLADRIHQFAERLGLEILAWLERAAADIVELDLADDLPGAGPMAPVPAGAVTALPAPPEGRDWINAPKPRPRTFFAMRHQ